MNLYIDGTLVLMYSYISIYSLIRDLPWATGLP